MLSCSLPGWRVAVLHPQLDPKYCVCSDRDPRVFLLTVALPSVLSAVQASVTLVNFYVLVTVLQANISYGKGHTTWREKLK